VWRSVRSNDDASEDDDFALFKSRSLRQTFSLNIS